MRGSPTPPEIAEQVRSIAAREGNVSEAARQAGIPNTTAFDIVKADDNFELFREQVQKEYIVKTWKNILDIETLLVKKIESLSPKELKYTGIRELTGALKDLKQTVENVLQEVTLKDGDRSITIGWKSKE